MTSKYSYYLSTAMASLLGNGADDNKSSTTRKHILGKTADVIGIKMSDVLDTSVVVITKSASIRPHFIDGDSVFVGLHERKRVRE